MRLSPNYHGLHHLANPGAARLHQCSVSLNFDGFRNLPDLQRNVDFRIRTDLQDDSSL